MLKKIYHFYKVTSKAKLQCAYILKLYAVVLPAPLEVLPLFLPQADAIMIRAT
jgi:hypothetical protein